MAPWRHMPTKPSCALHVASPDHPIELCLGHHRHPSMPPLWAPEACEPCSWPILRPLQMAMGQASHSQARCNDAGSGPVGHDGALDSEAALQPVTCGNLARQINLHQIGHAAGTTAWPWQEATQVQAGTPKLAWQGSKRGGRRCRLSVACGNLAHKMRFPSLAPPNLDTNRFLGLLLR